MYERSEIAISLAVLINKADIDIEIHIFFLNQQI